MSRGQRARASLAIAGALLISTASLAPAAGPITWSGPKVVDSQPPWDDADDFTSVSCASASLCVAVSRGGAIASSTNPIGGVAAWQVVKIPGKPKLLSVSCAPGPLCVATDD